MRKINRLLLALMALLALAPVLAQNYDATLSLVAATIFADDLSAVVDACPGGMVAELVCLRFSGDEGWARGRLDGVARSYSDLVALTAWTAGDGDYYARIYRLDDGLIISLGVIQLARDRTIIVVGAGYP